MTVTEHGVSLNRCHEKELEYVGPVQDAGVIEDGRIAEVFVNGGAYSFTWWTEREEE